MCACFLFLLGWGDSDWVSCARVFVVYVILLANLVLLVIRCSFFFGMRGALMDLCGDVFTHTTTTLQTRPATRPDY